MKVSRNWLQTFFYTDLPKATELAELFTFHAFEVEGIEEIKDTKGVVTDEVIDVKILPDRAHYCLSHRGIAEEIHVVTGLPLKKDRKMGTLPVGNSQIAIPQVSFNETNSLDSSNLFCRRYTARRVEGIVVGESAPWMKSYLTAIGERSISNIVDATNIVMFDTGQPLHAFDADKVIGAINVRHATSSESIVLLDGREISLLPTDFVIADEVGPLAIAGVKGGKRAEVTTSTKNIIIESANFNPTSVRRTSTRLNLRNESSKRFENEITPELTADGMSLVSALIAELIPSTATKMSAIVDIYPEHASQSIITIDRQHISDRLGVDVPEKVIDDIFSRLNISVSKKETTYTLTIPFHRLDLTIPEDIVEEVGRIYGYDKIAGKLPASSTRQIEISKPFYIAERIKNILISQGFSEVNLYTLVAKGQVETAYPLSKDKAFARANLTDGMMNCLVKNTPNADLLGLDVIKVFEIGKTFTAASESLSLSLGFARIKKDKSIKLDTVLLGFIGTISKQLSITIPSPKIIVKDMYVVCEINLEEIVSAYQSLSETSYKDLDFKPASKTVYKKFSLYPFMVRDIAVFVPDTIQTEEVWSSIKKGINDAQASKLLIRHALFDTFKKDGKTSYAFRMVFQSSDRTLTDDEANNIMTAVYAEMKKNGWEVR